MIGGRQQGTLWPQACLRSPSHAGPHPKGHFRKARLVRVPTVGGRPEGCEAGELLADMQGLPKEGGGERKVPEDRDHRERNQGQQRMPLRGGGRVQVQDCGPLGTQHPVFVGT